MRTDRNWARHTATSFRPRLVLQAGHSARRVVALVCATTVLIGLTILQISPASADITVAVSTPVASVELSAGGPLLTDPIGTVETIASSLISATTSALCTTTGNSTVCSLNVLSYGIETDYVRPDGTHLVKITGSTINVPTYVSASGGLLPDLQVTLRALSSSNLQLTINRLITAPTRFPVSVEALVADPTTANRVIHVGYDGRTTSAPQGWTATATVNTGTATNVNATVQVNGPSSSLATIGGIYDQGNNGARLNPKQARLNYTPVPATSTITLSLAPESDSGQVAASTPAKVDFELILLDGVSGQHITGTLQNLQQPVGLLFNKVDSTGQPTTTSGNPHVRVTTAGDVANAAVTYEQISSWPQVVVRAHVATGTLPTQTDFTETSTGFIATTTSPVDVSGGVSQGDSTHPIPNGYPIERTERSYVHQDTTGGISSTTFRVAGVSYVNVATVGPKTDRVLSITGRVNSAALHALVTDNGASNSSIPDALYDATINAVPHDFYVKIAESETRILEFCGSSSDATDPCSASGQAAPAGITSVVLNPSYSPAPLFGGATHLSGSVTGIPSTLRLDLTTHVPFGPTDPNQDTMVHVDASNSIGQVTLRATDGATQTSDPGDDGIVYIDTPSYTSCSTSNTCTSFPSKYAVVAKIDGISSAHLDTSPNLAVGLTAASGHDVSYSVDLPGSSGPGQHFDGVVTNRPATTNFAFSNVAGQPLTVHLDGSDAAGNPTGTGGITLNATNLSTDPTEKIHNIHATLTDLPPAVDLTKQPPISSTDTSINFNAKTSGGQIGTTDVELDNGNTPAASSIPVLPSGGGGAIVFTRGGQFFVHALVQQLVSVSLATAGSTDAAIDVAMPQDFLVHIDTGVGPNYKVNVNNCPDFDTTQHNAAHDEYTDVMIHQLQPGTAFHYQTYTDGNPNPCKAKGWKIIDYTAGGNADSITYDTNSGDMAHLHAVVGQLGGNPLKVPQHLRICQGSNDQCLALIGRSFQCSIGGVNYDYCSSAAADQTVYLETYGQRTHVSLSYCSLNNDATDFSACAQNAVKSGVFVDLNLSHVDLGYHYSSGCLGCGFFALNTKSPTTGIQQGMNGEIESIDHTSTAQFVDLSFGYNTSSSVPPWDPSQGSTWTNYSAAIDFASPLVGSGHGSANCVNPAYNSLGGPTFGNDFLHVSLTSDPSYYDNLTDLLCGNV